MPTKGRKRGRKKSPLKTATKSASRTSTMGRGVAANRLVRQREGLAGSNFPKWDYETDVLIVGYGAAGANAAIAAYDAGSRVLILEKLGFPGGNSGVCPGAMMIPESIDEAIRYYRSLSFGTVDEDLLRAFAEEMIGIPRLLTSLGAKSKVQRTVPPNQLGVPPALPGWQ